MAAYEQKVEPPDRKWQYLLFAAEPYETIAFKVRQMNFNILLFHTHTIYYFKVFSIILQQ